jgi:outer membrane protein assembly factor BamB
MRTDPGKIQNPTTNILGALTLPLYLEHSTGVHAKQWFVAVLMLFSVLASRASDWPQFLGPTRNGIYPGTDLAQEWPKEGPRVVWQRKVGQGFSGPVVSGGKLVLFHRLEDKETIECLDPGTGQSLWSFDYPTGYHDDFGFDEGPRATPAIEGDRVYTYGAEGVLHCLDLGTGKKLWSVDARKDFQAQKGFFGIACSPLVDSNSVFLNIGGRNGGGIVAFDKNNGKIHWRATSDEASYSSPTFARINGRSCAFFLTSANLVATDPTSGKIIFQTQFRPPIRTSVSAATPLIIGDLVFVSASYGTGAELLKVNGDSAEKVWSSDEVLSNHYATSIHYKGFLYGIHGRTDPGFEPGASLRCVELSTGKVRWEQKDFGAATLTLAGDQLLMLTERGELIRAAASPSGYQASARAQILPNQARAHPALADGRFYARSKEKLVCVDLRKPKSD